ncbi:hypothetical protein SDJN02_01589, partial [Cucurbita argyrosperma subsp. argyrosperma]
MARTEDDEDEDVVPNTNRIESSGIGAWNPRAVAASSGGFVVKGHCRRGKAKKRKEKIQTSQDGKKTRRDLRN